MVLSANKFLEWSRGKKNRDGGRLQVELLEVWLCAVEKWRAATMTLMDPCTVDPDVWRNPGRQPCLIGCQCFRVHIAFTPFLSLLTNTLLLCVLPLPLPAIAEETNIHDGSRRRSAGPPGHAPTA